VSQPVATINALINRMLEGIEREESREDLLALLDGIEDALDRLVESSIPERLTDERFQAVLVAMKGVEDAISRLRDALLTSGYRLARRRLLDLKREVRNAYRLLLLVRGGAPAPMVFQVVPEYVRSLPLQPPAPLAFSPMGAQIYSVLTRRGSATLEEIAAELGVTDANRAEFNAALAQLMQGNYVRIEVSPDNRIVLRPAR